MNERRCDRDLVKNEFVEEHYQTIALQPVSALTTTTSANTAEVQKLTAINHAIDH